MARVIEYDVPQYYKTPPALSFRSGAALQISGQTHRNDLNGKFVVCVCRDGMRTLVKTRGGDTLSVADNHLVEASKEDLPLARGTRVTLVGLHAPNSELNGQIAFIENFDASDSHYTVHLFEEKDASEESSISPPSAPVRVKPLNVVITPEGSEEHLPIQPLTAGKKRRLIANLVAGEQPPALVGSSSLLSSQPVPGATARLIAIDASVALSNQQPILKRCGTLRKLVHGFPGFAQLVVCLIVKLHLDPTHPGRTLDAADVTEAMKIAHLLTDGKLDGIPRKDIRSFFQDDSHNTNVLSLEKVLRIADRYCGATHLVFAIDSNFAGVKDSIAAMVHQITGGPPAPDLVEPTAAPPVIAMTSLMANRYASVKPSLPPPAEQMDTE